MCQIMEELEEMAARCPTDVPDLVCDTHVIGQSCEGRELKMLRVQSQHFLPCTSTSRVNSSVSLHSEMSN